MPSIQALEESLMADTINHADQKLKRSLGPERQNSLSLCAQGTRELPGAVLRKDIVIFIKTSEKTLFQK